MTLIKYAIGSFFLVLGASLLLATAWSALVWLEQNFGELIAPVGLFLSVWAMVTGCFYVTRKKGENS